MYNAGMNLNAPDNLHPVIEHGDRIFRDGVLTQLMKYLEERIEESGIEDPEKANLLQEILDATIEKQEIRKRMQDAPQVAEGMINQQQELITELSNELARRYPDEFRSLEYKNVLVRKSN